MERAVADPGNNWHQLIAGAAAELHPNVLHKLLTGFVINAGLVSYHRTRQLEQELGVTIPWTILLDPTAACNLKCVGSWAAEYSHTWQMEDALLDRIIREGKALGIYMYIYSGGEPLVRKDSLIRLAERHGDCAFMAFTNGTLVDEAFAAEMHRVGNLALAITVEGFEQETDMRRGQGTYRRVMRAMDILKTHGLLFGYSTCYHRYNTESVGSDAYVDLMLEKGARFAWYFTYMPLGKGARPDLLAEPEQRAYMYRRVRELRATRPLFAMDFWNDGEYVQGCIAGGRNYFHINAHGDVEPCAFIHYANVNIRDVSLLEALRSPMFAAYHRGQPFNANHLRPCPLLDNPERLEQMVRESGARSTQPGDQEDVSDLCAKCVDVSQRWAAMAGELWAAREGATLPEGAIQQAAPEGAVPHSAT
jgi:MoaA/NifB/PqqE/SkfB family radical SAM enzyme